MHRQHATPDVLHDWSTELQFRFAESLPLVAGWSCRDAVFQGGTALHMAWGSPRYSEDLDFLLSRDRAGELTSILKKVLQRMQASLMLSHPGLTLALKEKTKEGSNLQHYQIVATHPDYLERMMVKVEFWQVDSDYLSSYDSTFRVPVRQGDVISRSSTPLPVATLEAAYADKVTALATRPFLKWRDVFDLWWLGQQSTAPIAERADRFLHHVTAYATIDELPPADALRACLAREAFDDLVAKADPDLRKWLPPPLWNSLWPDGVRQMLSDTFAQLERIADHIDPPARGGPRP